MKPILLIDNYDSFVHNLARYFRRLGHVTRVVRNDAIGIEEIRKLAPAAVILSPGPCTPQEAGCSLEVVRRFYREIPMLGVCLGHQAIAAALGARVNRANEPMHGRTSPIRHHGQGLFTGVPNPLTVCRYHSLVVNPETLPEELCGTSWTSDGVLMSVEHCSLPVFGVQFHPESILTQAGFQLLGNFLRMSGLLARRQAQLAGELTEPRRRLQRLPDVPITF